MEPIIEVKGLTVRRGPTEALTNVTFEVDRGDYVGIVGPNGGGKTTLVLALLGLLPRASGSIRIMGQDIDTFDQWEKVGYVSQFAINFDPQFPLTVRELVGLGRVNRRNIGRFRTKEDWESVGSALELMGIAELADRRIGTLSGGQRQRAFVAKALVSDPELLVLDEPVTGFDPVTQERFFMQLANLNQSKGLTILIVSHDLTAVFCRMSRVLCVNREVHGATIVDGTVPDDILKKGYGEHFHFAFHEHKCRGEFADGRP
ncbi:MAG TPA: metal ABC transporter ATP-binding protein [Methanomassiliicoccales archaeon]|jgi:zinc transport system ATP-binding protein|nr:metal ABC transporter ATP-binding protein [Methanomassiliicoccales archaeon]HOO03261.1 metal ABC transporter ATP-binding protein [Methanomassiliicoccales archaeon]HQM66388.1 metal ABC transporter ATP-binding protein [Methanomassiliicoccales archaeon]HQN76493.1 metal ABC transporter ATP-binding protein [Methanomassiliicoccales archaeon]HRR66154.1 metal ABC transporter ATP-binding protein [Methanomassiliicoccales archaeon]